MRLGGSIQGPARCRGGHRPQSGSVFGPDGCKRQPLGNPQPPNGSRRNDHLDPSPQFSALATSTVGTKRAVGGGVRAAFGSGCYAERRGDRRGSAT